MKKMGLSFLTLLVFLLSGCGNTQSKEVILSKETLQSSEVKALDTDTSSQEKILETPWNKSKNEQLNNFMVTWGDEMLQYYKEYFPENNIDFYGVNIPDGLLDVDSVMNPAVASGQIDIKWSEDGLSGEADYKLVAVYSDGEYQRENAKGYFTMTLYFFVIKDGQPIVLVSQQNQGNPENNFYFRETENQKLKEGFSDIVRGNKSRIENTVSSEKTEPEVNLGTIAYKDLNTTDVVQNTALGMGCSIKDDGKTINFIPAMSGMHQTLQLYISETGATEEFASYSERIKEASLQTGGKAISLWSGDNQLMLTAQDGIITFSL